jgi:hypothetical protein
MVDLQGDHDVSRVVFYNRNDCCQDRADGALIQLLDANHTVIETRTLSQALVQPFTFAAGSGDRKVSTRTKFILSILSVMKKLILITAGRRGEGCRDGHLLR